MKLKGSKIWRCHTDPISMDALENTVVYATKTALSAQRELLQRVNKVIYQNNCWPKYKDAQIQISVAEGHIAGHSFWLSLLLSRKFLLISKWINRESQRILMGWISLLQSFVFYLRMNQREPENLMGNLEPSIKLKIVEWSGWKE